MTLLPPAFLRQPIAHRGLHDLAQGVQENSPSAFARAISHGYGIELDLQLTADGHAVVFHDYDLARLTGASGSIRTHTTQELSKIRLKGAGESIPTLEDVLALVDAQTPLLIEIKDQDGMLGPNVGALEHEVARLLSGYGGAVAVMSFNPHSMAALRRAAPDLPLGLTSCDFQSVEGWHYLPEERRAELTALPDFDHIGAEFISHRYLDLQSDRVAELKSQGASVLSWTIRSTSQEVKAREVAHNVTFEGYLPDAHL